MTEVTLRPASREDAETIAHLIRELADYEKLLDEAKAGPEDILRDGFGARPFFECLLAEVAGEAVGFALFFPNYSTFEGRPGLYLEDLYVAPRARGLGVGRKMIARLAAIAIERDWRRLRRATEALLERLDSQLGRERDALRVLAPSARLAAQRSRLEAGARALERAVAAQLAGLRSRLAERAGRLESLSPLGVLARGYALVRRSRDGAIVRSADQLARGERLAIRVAEAELEASLASARPLPKS